MNHVGTFTDSEGNSVANQTVSEDRNWTSVECSCGQFTAFSGGVSANTARFLKSCLAMHQQEQMGD